MLCSSERVQSKYNCYTFGAIARCQLCLVRCGTSVNLFLLASGLDFELQLVDYCHTSAHAKSTRLTWGKGKRGLRLRHSRCRSDLCKVFNLNTLDVGMPRCVPSSENRQSVLLEHFA